MIQPIDVTEGFVKVAKVTRALGFFTSYQHLSDIELAHKLAQFERRQSRSHYTMATDLPDAAILLWDKERVWKDGHRLKALPENRAYQQTIEHWGRISRGAFTPRAVHETWVTRSGPIIITFMENGQAIRLNVTKLGIKLNIGDLIRPINRLIQHTGIQLTSIVAYRYLVVALAEEERLILERELDWTLFALQFGR